MTREAPPPPPEGTDELVAWAEAHGVAARLDDVLVGGYGPAGTSLPGRDGESLTYRDILLSPPSPGGAGARQRRGTPHDADETARTYLHRLAVLTAAHRDNRDWMDANGRDPEDEVLGAFLDRLRATLSELPTDGEVLPPGTYERARVQVSNTPAPRLLYEEWTLTGPRGPGASVDEISLLLLGWNEGELRWARHRGGRAVAGDVAPALRRRA